MSLLVALREPGADAAAALAQRVQTAAARQGFARPERLDWPGGQGLWFAPPDGVRGSGACVQDGARFAACVGTVHWRGLTREALLRRLLQDFESPHAMPLRDFSGAFTMLFGAAHGTWIFNDAVGLQKLYTACDGRVLSNSLLLCRSLLRRPAVNRLRAQEYVLLGSTHARETPVDGVQVMEPTQALDLRGGAQTVLHAAAAWRVETRFASEGEAVEALASTIADDFAGMLQAFGPQVGMALSGGFDSRLLLAALDHHGVAPTLYVYGRPSDDDVRIASAKAAQLGLPITCVDKGRANAELPPLSRQRVADNLAFFDGLPVDGVFDRGTDQATRLQQVRDGTLNLNGGGGEILRNFFYLPDRGYTAVDLVGAFYSNWLPRAVPDADERRALTQATADGILRELGFEAGDDRARARTLSRRDVELVYALFRLRWWMARNNTVAARYGAFMTPLVHPRLVERAATVPIAWKTYGALEARIITRLSPRVAAGPSNYGFDFSQGPTPAHRRYIDATLYRPIALRRRSARLRRLLGRNGTATMPAEWLQAYAPPAVDWIDPAFLTDRAQLNRMLTLCALLDDELCGLG